MVVIIAALATAATPLYQKHAQRLRVLDGQAKLLEAMDLEHRYHARELIYTDDLEALGLDGEHVLSGRAHYQVSAIPCKDDISACVKLTASPSRENDPTLTLDSRGRRTPAGAWR